MTSSTSQPLALLLIALALLAQACAGSLGGERVSAEEQTAFDAVMADVGEDDVAAIEGLETFLQQYPHSALADDAAYALAEIHLRRGEREQALRRFYYVVRHKGDGDLADAARIGAARLELMRGDGAAASRLLDGLRDSRLTRAQRLEAYGLRARAADDALDKLTWLIRMRSLPDQDDEVRVAIDVEISNLLARMSRDDLLRARDELGRSVVGGRIELQLAEHALSKRDLEGAAHALQAAEGYSLRPIDEQRLERLAERFALLELALDRADLPTFAEAMGLGWREPELSTATLGVILPLSGPFARYGEESLRGILLAAEVFDPRTPEGGERPPTDAPPKFRVLVRDSAGEPAQAAAAVRELAERDDVVAIVGPLLSAECEAAAREAEDYGVPLLTLTSRQEIPLQRPNVMRLRTTPDDEIHYLVNYAVTELGAKRFAVLYPQDAYGLGMRDRYWQAVESLGGHVVAASSYELGAVDFADPIREMIGYVLLTPKEQQVLRQRKKLLERGRRLDPKVAAVAREVSYSILGPEGEPLPPRVDFDVLFIPDAHDKVVLIAPQLAFHELDHVQLLGSSGWNHPDLVRIARGHVRGAVVATPFHLESPFPFVTRFVERYVATFDSPPDSYSAHAFDAAELVLLQLADGRSERDEMREGLLRVNGYPGSSGVFSFVEDGNARKRPFLLRVRGGNLIPLDSLN